MEWHKTSWIVICCSSWKCTYYNRIWIKTFWLMLVNKSLSIELAPPVMKVWNVMFLPEHVTKHLSGKSLIVLHNFEPRNKTQCIAENANGSHLEIVTFYGVRLITFFSRLPIFNSFWQILIKNILFTRLKESISLSIFSLSFYAMSALLN